MRPWLTTGKGWMDMYGVRVRAGKEKLTTFDTYRVVETVAKQKFANEGL